MHRKMKKSHCLLGVEPLLPDLGAGGQVGHVHLIHVDQTCDVFTPNPRGFSYSMSGSSDGLDGVGGGVTSSLGLALVTVADVSNIEIFRVSKAILELFEG